MITLKDAKNYLRVDWEEDDRLISDLLETSKRLVMDVGRMSNEHFAEQEDTVRTAVLLCLSYLYESRNTADFHSLTLSLRAILFAQRKGII